MKRRTRLLVPFCMRNQYLCQWMLPPHESGRKRWWYGYAPNSSHTGRVARLLPHWRPRSTCRRGPSAEHTWEDGGIFAPAH